MVALPLQIVAEEPLIVNAGGVFTVATTATLGELHPELTFKL